VSHLHLKESSWIPSLLRHPDSFTITRLESSSGLADRITKVSSVPALLVSVSIKSLAMGDYQLWVDDKPSTNALHSTHSTVPVHRDRF
jgi:AraC family transcriptional regulator